MEQIKIYNNRKIMIYYKGQILIQIHKERVLILLRIFLLRLSALINITPTEKD
jgi:hypothetical protein